MLNSLFSPHWGCWLIGCVILGCIGAKLQQPLEFVRHTRTIDAMHSQGWWNFRLRAWYCVRKIPRLRRQYGDGAVGVMKLVKQALDPRKILNPGPS